MKNIDNLTSKYWEATISDSELEQLKDLLSDCSELTEEQKALQMMLGAFKEMGCEYEDRQPTLIPQRSYSLSKIIWSVAAIAALLVVGIISFYSTENTPQQEIYCYINDEPITDINVALEQTKYFDSIAELSQTMDELELISGNLK